MTTEDQDQRQDRPAPLVAVASADAVLRHPEAGEHLLTDLEHQRAARFRKESGRLDFTAGHILVRLCAARLLGVPAAALTLAQQCPDCGRADHGKPFLPDRPDVHVSLSHTQGVVAAAAGYEPVGVDVELAARGGTLQGVAERVLTPAELALVVAAPEPDRAFLRLWVRKESLIKIGRAGMDSLAEVDLSALPLDVPADGPLRSRYLDLHLLDWTDPEHGAAVAAVSTAEPQVVELTAGG
ncbi:4'-phosphopantetheinyl transferase superfamily protein [Kitasatospora aureofaciens]|uniref:4'-phosphopantetheinyl transferase family protein n=1 Tax=Kitasatospora aureofaciens TaxID=1894 RepID=UPI001C443888|nr:4'-phosphopantetheinyl transferase superfamily protein [Kitasatospora aureofaciens]MBV6696013.1 4'-phosphopantetheinyl transferase superfamily protein [Kitasatospora aureofaciens]